MTKDDVIRMACKADNIHINCEGYLPDPDEESMEEFLVAFANLVAAAERKALRDEMWEKAMKLVSEAVKFEREACAVICDNRVLYTGYDCAAAIRSQS